VTAPVAAAAARGAAGRGAATQAAKPAAKAAQAGQGGGRVASAADGAAGYVLGGRGRKSKAAPSRAGYQRVLVAELLLCTVILALSPMVDKEIKPGQWMKRGTALCAVFMLLGMVSSVGPKSGRAAGMLGGLITLTLLVDQRSLFGVLATTFGGSAATAEEQKTVDDTWSDLPEEEQSGKVWLTT
jgi:hypothetical protein